MKNYLCAFVLLIAVVSTQQDFLVDTATQPQVQYLTVASKPTKRVERFYDFDIPDKFGAHIRKAPTNVVNQAPAPANPVSLAGKYSTNLLNDPNVAFEFTDKKVNLVGGCNNQGGEYKALSDGSFSVSKFFSTLKACSIDKDSVYTNALSQSTSFMRSSDGSITFRSSKAEITLILTPSVNKPKEIKFDGNYIPSIKDDSDLLIRLEPDGKVSMLNACNNPFGTYKAFEDGSISFGQFASTKKLCPDDKDSIYANALTSSVQFAVQGALIILYSKEGKQIMILTPIGIVLPADPSACKANEVLTPSGCWNSCADPRFKQCPDVFPAVFRPDFCAYTKNGQYVSETFDCQACKRQDALAVRNRACSCDFIKCGSGEVCQNGQCVKRFPVDPLPCKFACVKGFFCRNGECVPETPIDKCATIRCGFGTVCKDGQCVQPTPVGTDCRNGKCVQEPANPCANVRCHSGTSCQNGQCVLQDICNFIKCRKGDECKNGECVPIPGFCGKLFCLDGFVCLNNKCVSYNQQQSVQCVSDFQCRNGETCEKMRCVSKKCFNVKCYPGSHCENGKCVPGIQGNSVVPNQLPGFPSFPSFSNPNLRPNGFGQAFSGFDQAFNGFVQPQNVFDSFGQIGLAPFNQNRLDPFNQNRLDPFNQNGLDPFNQNRLDPFNQNGLDPFNQNQPFNRNQPAGEVCGRSICRIGTFCQNGRCVALVPQNFPSSPGTQTPVSDCSLCPPNAACLNNVCLSA